MNKKFYFSILFGLMVFTLSTPALAGGSFSTLTNASFDYWNGGTLDDWTISVEITASSHTGANKVDGNASLYVSDSANFEQSIYQAAGGLNPSTVYTVSASVLDPAGDAVVKLCIDQIGSFTEDLTTCSSESTGAGSFETIQVSATTDGSGDLGYIFFFFTTPGSFLILNQKPAGGLLTIDMYIDNLVIGPPVNEFGGTFPILLLSVSIFVISVLVYQKKRI